MKREARIDIPRTLVSQVMEKYQKGDESAQTTINRVLRELTNDPLNGQGVHNGQQTK